MAVGGRADGRDDVEQVERDDEGPEGRDVDGLGSFLGGGAEAAAAPSASCPEARRGC